MRFTILRMIAAGSLSAFNTAVQPSVPPLRPPAGAAVQQARSPAPATPQPVQPGLDKPGALSTGRILPRGSLLNLSV
jgi:hypothetical protein